MVRPEPGSCLYVALVVSGVEVARARCRPWHGTGESVVSIRTAGCIGCCRHPGRQEGEARVVEATWVRVPMRGTEADQPVVAMKAL
jgi:hypothetical protein